MLSDVQHEVLVGLDSCDAPMIPMDVGRALIELGLWELEPWQASDRARQCLQRLGQNALVERVGEGPVRWRLTEAGREALSHAS